MNMLEGARVVAFNHFMMGPLAAQTLGDLGADVISVESLEGAFQRHWGLPLQSVDGQSMTYLAGGRNKRSLSIDLKSEEGNAIARQLVAKADIVIENFRPGVLERLGLGYEAVKAVNPSIIYSSGSGYGLVGPYQHRPGQDLLVQAMSGMASATGTRDEARAIGVTAIDVHCATMLALGTIAAYVRKLRTGEGCRVDASLLAASIDMQLEAFSFYLNGPGPQPSRMREKISGWFSPGPYGMYEASDGAIAISVAPPTKLCAALEAPELEGVSDDALYEQRDLISTVTTKYVAQKSRDYWIERLTAFGIWAERVKEYDEVVQDPQIIHNKHFVTVPGATGSPIGLITHPVRYDGEVPSVRRPPPKLGAETVEILGELGFDRKAVDELVARKIVRVAEHA